MLGFLASIPAASAATVRLRDGSERPIELTELASLPVAQAEELRLAEPMAASRWRLGLLVRTAAGDALRTEQVRLRNEVLWLDSPMTGPVQLPLSAASLIWFVAPATLGETARREVEQTAAHASGKDTLFIRKTGEWVRLEGVLKALDERRASFLWQETEREIPLRLAAAVALAGSSAPAGPREALAAVIGRDGSQLVGALRTWTSDSITLASPTLGDLTVPLDSVAVVDALWGRSVFVSGLQPAAVAEAGYFGTVFPWRCDASVSGRPLSLHGRSFQRGLGVHARSSLSYRLDKKFSLLTGVIGLDDAGGGPGRVQFVVHGDGRELFRAAMSAADEPRRLRIGVGGVDRLELLVDYGAAEDTGDHADWADLRLVR